MAGVERESISVRGLWITREKRGKGMYCVCVDADEWNGSQWSLIAVI